MLVCFSLQHWVQIKLSASVPTWPEGVTTHTVPSYKQTPLHAAGLQRLPKAREKKSREGAWRENMGQKEKEKRKEQQYRRERMRWEVEDGKRAACRLPRTWLAYSWMANRHRKREGRESLESWGKLGPSGCFVALPGPEVWLGDSRPTCSSAPFTQTHMTHMHQHWKWGDGAKHE